MGDFTKYELESIKIKHNQNTKKDLKSRKMLMIKLISFFCFLGIAIFLIYKLIANSDNTLEDAMKEDIPMSKEWQSSEN